MKRILFVFIIVILLLTACGRQTESPTEDVTGTVTHPATLEEEVVAPRLQVIATIFPQYDFIRQIAGNRVELTMLLPLGAEAHSFEPTSQDIIRLHEADLFVYTGGHGERWVETILAPILEERDMHTVALIDLVDVLGVQHNHEHHHVHDHSHSHEHSHCHDHNHTDTCDVHNCDDNTHEHCHSLDYSYCHDHCHADSCDAYDCDDDTHVHHNHNHEHHNDCDDDRCELAFDEHVWTSPRNAIQIVAALTEILAELDQANADYFRANAAAYIAELEALDAAFTEVMAQAIRHTIVFGDRNPFRYLAHTYGLHYYAAFIGCGTETQASPATIAALIELVRQENIPVIFTIEFSNQLIANTIAEETGATILELHSAHNLSPADFNAGVTYLDLMRRNLEHLREALN